MKDTSAGRGAVPVEAEFSLAVVGATIAARADRLGECVVADDVVLWLERCDASEEPNELPPLNDRAPEDVELESDDDDEEDVPRNELPPTGTARACKIVLLVNETRPPRKRDASTGTRDAEYKHIGCRLMVTSADACRAAFSLEV
jgi:hypothetical protein